MIRSCCPEPLLHNGEDLSVVSSLLRRSLPLNCGLAPIYFVRLRVAVLENRLPDRFSPRGLVLSQIVSASNLQQSQPPPARSATDPASAGPTVIPTTGLSSTPLR